MLNDFSHIMRKKLLFFKSQFDTGLFQKAVKGTTHIKMTMSILILTKTYA